MSNASLAGRSILVCEDEPLIHGSLPGACEPLRGSDTDEWMAPILGD
jgi:hypothetical protein